MQRPFRAEYKSYGGEHCAPIIITRLLLLRPYYYYAPSGLKLNYLFKPRASPWAKYETPFQG